MQTPAIMQEDKSSLYAYAFLYYVLVQQNNYSDW